MCEAKIVATSFCVPVRIFTTPPGTSDEFNTSANVMEQSGKDSEAKAITVLPPVITGIIRETRPINEVF